MIDFDGYPKLVDFGISRIVHNRTYSTIGTPHYMAPEVICRQNHSTSADYFALGVIVFEFMIGKRPYLGKTRKDIRDAILAKQVQVNRNDIPMGWSPEVIDFINGLLQRKPQNRLGANGIEEIKNHLWLKKINWNDLLHQKLISPFIPASKDNFDLKQVTSGWPEEGEQVDLQLSSVQSLFSGYYYDGATQEVTNDIAIESIKKN